MTLAVKPAMIRCRWIQSAHIQHTSPRYLTRGEGFAVSGARW